MRALVPTLSSRLCAGADMGIVQRTGAAILAQRASGQRASGCASCWRCPSIRLDKNSHRGRLAASGKAARSAPKWGRTKSGMGILAATGPG
jgi:hypothetical protein